jgi:tRNA pseudouridine38-40 synthase
VRIDLAYAGTHFHGWQRQSGLRTVQGELADQLARLLGRPACPIGAGRTDTGVHARGQVCHVAVASQEEAARLQRALPRLKTADLQIRAVRVVSPAFDARFSALARRYSYQLRFARDIFQPHTAWEVEPDLDRAAMVAAAAQFLGTHDFTSFCKTSSLHPDTNACEVDLCSFQWQDDSAIFHMRANRFLHHMVRNMVGTLYEVGCGRRAPVDIPTILAARERRRAGRTAPAHGLYLEEVTYPPELLDPAYRPQGSPPDSGLDHTREGDLA